MSTTVLLVKNFRRFQHYRDRNPPWIKLYTSLLTDVAFVSLPDAARSHLMLLWIVASRSEGILPDDAGVLSRLIGASTPVQVDRLVRAGFLTRCKPDASTALATPEHGASEAQPTENRGQNDNYPINNHRARARFALADWSAVEAFLSRFPDHAAEVWGTRLAGYLDGLDFPGGKAATPAAIATACRDLAEIPEVTPARFRRYVERAMVDAANPVGSKRPNGKPEDEYEALARRYEAEEPHA